MKTIEPSDFDSVDGKFQKPDLSASYSNELNDVVSIEAYKWNDNEDKHLKWVSVGHPILIEQNKLNNKSNSLFHFTSHGFHTFVRMLTNKQQKILAEKAKEKYNRTDIAQHQIEHLILSKFECRLTLGTDEQNSVVIGKVSSFKTFPLRMVFTANAKEKELLKSNLLNKDEHGLELLCEIKANGGFKSNLALYTDADSIIQIQKFNISQNLTPKMIQLLVHKLCKYYFVFQHA